MGTSRNTRALSALAPNSLAIDGRTPRQLIAQTVPLAGLFNYFSRSNTPAGQWDQFYTSVPLVRYALFAEIRLDLTKLRLQKALNKIGPEIDLHHPGEVVAAWNIMDRLLAGYLMVDDFARAFAAWPDEWRFAATLKDAIQGALARDCLAVLGCANWLLGYQRPPYRLQGWSTRDGFLNSPLLGNNGWPAAATTPLLFGDTLSVRRQFTQTLAEAAWSSLGVGTHLASQAGRHFQHNFESPKALPPHFGIVLAFLRQFQGAQGALNGVTAAHCDYFFRRILNLDPAAEKRDRTFVAFTAAPGQHVELPAGTLLVAGKEADGEPMIYATRTPTRVSGAGAVSVATVLLEPFDTARFRDNQGSGFYLAPAIAAERAGNAAWPTFGGPPPSDGKELTRSNATIGFALCSPVLHLEGGRRLIVVTVEFAPPSPEQKIVALPAAHPWSIDYSAPSGWARATAVEGALVVGADSAGSPLPVALRIVVRLGPGDPPCIDYDRDTMGFAFGGQRAPVLRVTYANPLVAFGDPPTAITRAFAVAPISRIRIDVEVEDLGDLTLVGPNGRLAPGGSVPLFGAPPVGGARFLVGKVELFRKRLRSLALRLDWDSLPTDEEAFPHGLRDYYAGYLATVPNPSPTMFRNDQYRAAFSALSDGAWQRLDLAPASPGTPAPAPPPARFLFDWTGATDGKNPAAFGRLKTTSTWTADAAALATLTPDYGLSGPLELGSATRTGFLGLELVAPVYLFGAQLYPAAVSAAAFEQTRSIASAATQKPATAKPGAKPRLGYERLKVALAPSLLERLAVRLQLKIRPWFTFHPGIFPALARLQQVPSGVIDAAQSAGVAEPKIQPALLRLHDEIFRDEEGCRRRIAQQLCLGWPPSAEGGVCIDVVMNWLSRLAPAAPGEAFSATPPRPLVPTCAARIARYTAGTTLDFGPAGKSASSGWDAVWQFSPLATYRMPVDGARLLPSIEAGGHLYIGLRDLAPSAGAAGPISVSLLFVLEEAPVPDFGGRPTRPAWSCLVGDLWCDNLHEHAVRDDTLGFLRSGLVRIDLPAGANTEHTVMPPNFVWLRAWVPDPQRRLRTVRLWQHAAEAEWRPSAGLKPEIVAAHFDRPLPAGSIVALQSPNPGIQKVDQPLPGFAGAPPEDSAAFRQRVSERLRHKGRAVAPPDYEQLLLESNPSVFFARAVPPRSATEAGRITLVVLPTVRTPPAAPPPGFVPTDLALMTDSLQKLAPLSAEVRIVNPTYESVIVEVQADFAPDRSWTFYADKLNEDLKAFISPWIYDQAHATEPLQALQASEVLLHLRDNLRAYVTRVGTCAIRFEQERSAAVRDRLAVSDPQVLLISAARHAIEPLSSLAQP